MNHDNSPIEELLRDALSSRAGGAPLGPDRTSVIRRAHSIRRHRRQGFAAVTAAAVVAVVVPVSLTVGNGNGTKTPGPADHSTKPSPTQTAVPKTPRYTSLAQIPRGKDTTISYLGPDGLIHDNGSTTAVPGGAKAVTGFGEYQGNLVIVRDLTTTVYDPTGKVVMSGSSGAVKYSADRTDIAFQLKKFIYESSRNTMGNAGAQPYPAPRDSGLLGFLPQGPAVTASQDSVTIIGTPDKTIPLPLMPTVVSQSTGLVGGAIGTVAKGNLEGAMTDVTKGTILWHNEWEPMAFSDDGKYVAARPIADNGDTPVIAILDARTGRPVAQTPRFGTGVNLVGNVAWEGDTLVVDAMGGKGRTSALLSLDLSGKLTRVTEVTPGPLGKETFVLGAQP